MTSPCQRAPSRPWALANKLLLDTLSFHEVHAMGILQGADTSHLRVVIWVQDAQGQILTPLQSTCQPADKGGPTRQTR